MRKPEHLRSSNPAQYWAEVRLKKALDRRIERLRTLANDAALRPSARDAAARELSTLTSCYTIANDPAIRPSARDLARFNLFDALGVRSEGVAA